MMTIKDEVAAIVAAHRTLDGPLLPILHRVQGQFGHIPAEAVPLIASALNLSVAEVHGVISFYHDFRSAPAGEHRVKVCCAEACQARGSRSLAIHAAQALGVEYGGTTGDGRVTLEKVYCLGNCACGPSVLIGDRVYANVDTARFDRLISNLSVESSQ